MADVVISLQELAVNQGSFRTGIAGEAISAGQAVYLDESELFLSQATDPVKAKCYGIAVMNGQIGDVVQVLYTVARNPSRIVLAASGIIAGTQYVVSATPGGIAPRADLGSGATVVSLGIGRSDGKSIDVNIQETETVLP